MRPHLTGLAVALALAASTATLAGCTSSTSASHASTSRTGAGPSTAPPAAATHRWWSNAAVRAGSVVDPADPTAAAAHLRPSRTQYCTMLKQTMAAGHSILPGADADDPRLATAATAFVAELQRVAPTEVSRQWQTVGDAITRVVAPSTTSKITSVDVTSVHASVAQIAADARNRCGVSLAHHPH